MENKDQILLNNQLSLILKEGPIILPNAQVTNIPKIKFKTRIALQPKLQHSKCKESTSSAAITETNFVAGLRRELSLGIHQNLTKQSNQTVKTLPKSDPPIELGSTEKKLPRCSYCTKYCRSQKELLIHERVHTGEQPFQCKHGSKKFTWKQTWISHAKGCRPRDTSKTKKDGAGSSKPVTMKSKKGKEAWSELRTWTPPVRKPVSVSVSSVKGAGAKSRRPSSTAAPTKNKTSSYSFSSSSRRSSSTTRVITNLHQKIGGHFKMKVFSCCTCQKLFALKEALKVHERTHTAERPYICTHCNLSYRQQSGLNYHLKKSKLSVCAEIQKRLANVKLAPRTQRNFITHSNQH